MLVGVRTPLNWSRPTRAFKSLVSTYSCQTFPSILPRRVHDRCVSTAVAQIVTSPLPASGRHGTPRVGRRLDIHLNNVNQSACVALWLETTTGGPAMDAEVCSHAEPATSAHPPATSPVDVAPPVVAAGLAASLAGCGGGGADSPASSPAAAPPTAAEASRFLAQASMGARRAQIERTQ